MRLRLLDGSRVFIDLRATGMLRALAHSPTLAVRPERVAVELDEAAGQGSVGVDTGVEAVFAVTSIEAPADISPGDREKMVENLRGREVLDAGRFPTIDFQGRYAGTLDQGTLAGDLRVRGRSHRVSIPVSISSDGVGSAASGAWEGRLTDLGVKPFKALLGAIKLEDWVRLRIDVRLAR
jgi:polyisoprenoid-binding protein YceI